MPNQFEIGLLETGLAQAVLLSLNGCNDILSPLNWELKVLESSSILYQNYWTAALGYWRDPKERSWILVSPGSIGDTWCVCALGRAFRDTHGAPLTLVVRESQQAIVHMFPDIFDRVIIWDDMRLTTFSQRLIGQGAFAIDEPILAHPYWHGLGRFVGPLFELLRYPGRGGLTLADQFRLILQLDWESKLAQVEIPESWRLEAEVYADQIGLARGNSVILLPDNNTNPSLPDTFWEDLTTQLVASGKKVFTNMAGNSTAARSEPFKGSFPINMTIRLGVPLAELAGRFISMANGFQSMLLGSHAATEHTILLHDFPSKHRIVGPGFPVKDPVAWQTFRGAGFCNGAFNEFVVRPDVITRQLIKDVAANNPGAMITF